jgi:hypothetical protein
LPQQADQPGLESVPFRQIWQVVEPMYGVKVPLLHWAHATAPGDEAYEPAAQGKQVTAATRSLYFPAEQMGHAVAPAPGLNLPGAQSSQYVAPV